MKKKSGNLKTKNVKPLEELLSLYYKYIYIFFNRWANNNCFSDNNDLLKNYFNGLSIKKWPKMLILLSFSLTIPEYNLP